MHLLEDDAPSEDDPVERLLNEGAFFVPWSKVVEDVKRKIPALVRRELRTLPEDVVAALLVKRLEDDSFQVCGLYTMSQEQFDAYVDEKAAALKEAAVALQREQRFRAVMAAHMRGESNS